MALDLFAGARVRDYDASRSWYERLLGKEPTFFPHATEAVWELAEHRYVFIVEDNDAPGGANILIWVDDLDGRVGEIAARGIEPAERETLSNGVRKVIYRDPDGNELALGGAPAGAR
jgi:catechol 2,3-dioxygenase-like lactoylglutathione lyase family enzyme